MGEVRDVMQITLFGFVFLLEAVVMLQLIADSRRPMQRERQKVEIGGHAPFR